VGAGDEQVFGTLHSKVEYRYTAYSKRDLDFGVDAGLDRHQLLVGIGYRF